MNHLSSPKQDIFSDAPGMARDILAKYLGLDDLPGRFRVDGQQCRLRIKFVSRSLGRNREEPATKMELECDCESRQMWVGMLQVAPSIRFRGLGKRLAAAAEEIGRQFGMVQACVLPYPEADSFWRRLGYEPQKGASRVRSKPIGSPPNPEKTPKMSGQSSPTSSTCHSVRISDTV